jgi:hypothetical protein
VAKGVLNALDNYRATNGHYPAASQYAGGPPHYRCVPGELKGHAPLKAKSSPPQDGCTSDWENGKENGELKQPQLPEWFAANDWNLYTHYAVASACTMSDPAVRATCDANGGASPLTVSGLTAGARALVIVSGPNRGGLGCSGGAQCLEDSANSDGDNHYVKPSRYPVSNDRMAVTCTAANPCPVGP